MGSILVLLIIIIIGAATTYATDDVDAGFMLSVILLVVFAIISMVNAVTVGSDAEREEVETYLYGIKGISTQEEVTTEPARGVFFLGCGYIKGGSQTEELKYIYFAEYEGKGSTLAYSNVEDTYIYETNEQAPAAYQLETITYRKTNWLDKLWGEKDEVLTLTQKDGIKLVVPEGTIKMDYNISL